MALLTLSGMVAACAETSTGEVTTEGGAAATEAPAVETTAEETLYAPDDLKEKYDFNETITIFMWSDYTMMEFYAEETGDAPVFFTNSIFSGSGLPPAFPCFPLFIPIP